MTRVKCPLCGQEAGVLGPAVCVGGYPRPTHRPVAMVDLKDSGRRAA